MPLYEYGCSECGKTTEIIQKFSDPPAQECPHCGKTGLHKIISQTSFHLKGGGWYASDYKKKATGSGSSSGSSSEGSSGSSGSEPSSSGTSGTGDSGSKTAGCASGACKAGGAS